jgi:hypothetical protein
VCPKAVAAWRAGNRWKLREEDGSGRELIVLNDMSKWLSAKPKINFKRKPYTGVTGPIEKDRAVLADVLPPPPPPPPPPPLPPLTPLPASAFKKGKAKAAPSAAEAAAAAAKAREEGKAEADAKAAEAERLFWEKVRAAAARAAATVRLPSPPPAATVHDVPCPCCCVQRDLSQLHRAARMMHPCRRLRPHGVPCRCVQRDLSQLQRAVRHAPCQRRMMHPHVASAHAHRAVALRWRVLPRACPLLLTPS